jgi:hypothetical protein
LGDARLSRRKTLTLCEPQKQISVSICARIRHLTIMLSRRAWHLVAAGAALDLFAPRAHAATSRELFTLSRSKNANVVKYAVRTDAQGGLDAASPVEAYWLMLAENGRREELTWTERKLAYGFSISRQSRQGFALHLSACSKREVYVLAAGGSFRAELGIAGQRAFLQRIFVSTEEGLLLPHVRYIELSGITASAQRVTERIIPH